MLQPANPDQRAFVRACLRTFPGRHRYSHSRRVSAGCVRAPKLCTARGYCAVHGRALLSMGCVVNESLMRHHALRTRYGSDARAA